MNQLWRRVTACCAVRIVVVATVLNRLQFKTVATRKGSRRLLLREAMQRTGAEHQVNGVYADDRAVPEQFTQNTQRDAVVTGGEWAGATLPPFSGQSGGGALR